MRIVVSNIAVRGSASCSGVSPKWGSRRSADVIDLNCNSTRAVESDRLSCTRKQSSWSGDVVRRSGRSAWVEACWRFPGSSCRPITEEIEIASDEATRDGVLDPMIAIWEHNDRRVFGVRVLKGLAGLFSSSPRWDE